MVCARADSTEQQHHSAEQLADETERRKRFISDRRMQCNGNDLKVFMILFQKFIFSDDLDYFHLKLSSKFGLLFGDYTDTDSDCDSEPIK